MNELLQNPAVQAGVLPSIVGLAVGALLLRSRYLVLVPLAALAAVVTVALGWSMEPLTTVRKVVLCVLGAGAVALVLEALSLAPTRVIRIVLAAAATALAGWVGSRALAQLEGAEFWLRVVLLLGMATATVYGLSATAGDALSSLCASTVLGFTAGLLALLGASASQAFMGIGIGAASGMVVLLQMARGRAPLTHYLLLPVLAFAALAPLVAHLTGGLPWLALLPLPFVAPAAALLKAPDKPVWQQAMLSGLPALVPAFVALALAWFRVGAPAS